MKEGKKERMVVVRSWGELLFNGYKVQFCKMKRVLKMNIGDGCITMNELSTTDLYV